MHSVRELRCSMILTAILTAVVSSRALGADPPGRVGRVSYLGGSVSFRAGSGDDWTAATLNYPVATGDELRTPAGGRAELHIGSSAVRLGPETLVDFLDVSDQDTRLRLTEGSLYLRVRQLGSGDSYEVATPDGAVSLLDAGHYRIDVSSNGRPTFVTVRDGKAELRTGSGTTVSVRPGETVSVTGPNSTGSEVTTIAVDDWETWAEARDRRDDESISLRYVSPELVGFGDLDDYGTWEVDATFGPVWVPTVAAGWAPYRFGSWAWVAPWGWTWIDDAPWGFAPFHYGRWAFRHGGWAWVPGRFERFPVYAPALVAFVGGSGFDLSLDFGIGGGLAWFPLAPGEAFFPRYGVSRTYIRDINATSVNVREINFTRTDVTKVRYLNRSVPGAITAVSRKTFLSGGQVAKATVRVPPSAVAKASVIGMSAPLAPARERMVPRTAARPAAATGNRPFDAAQQREWQTERDQALARQAAERAELERRQEAELSAPPAGVSPDGLRERQAQERQTLTQRQHAETDTLDRRYRRNHH